MVLPQICTVLHPDRRHWCIGRLVAIYPPNPGCNDIANVYWKETWFTYHIHDWRNCKFSHSKYANDSAANTNRSSLLVLRLPRLSVFTIAYFSNETRMMQHGRSATFCYGRKIPCTHTSCARANDA